MYHLTTARQLKVVALRNLRNCAPEQRDALDKHLAELNHSIAEGLAAKSYKGTVVIAEDAGLDLTYKAYASCDRHGVLMGCPNKTQAARVAHDTREFCDECRTLGRVQ